MQKAELIVVTTHLKVVYGSQVVYTWHAAEFERQQQLLVILTGVPQVLPHLEKISLVHRGTAELMQRYKYRLRHYLYFCVCCLKY